MLTKVICRHEFKIFSLFIIFFFISCAFSQVAPPLYLSNYLDNPALGRTLSRVYLNGLGESYSGFFTVNSKYDSNMFFWFLPAQNGNTSAPVLLWLSGGPGFSSLYGLFYENGPVSVSEQFTLVPRNTTWNKEFNVIYIDNPIGAGFSYTNSTDGFSTNQNEIAVNLFSTLQQFFEIFTSYRKNDFYVCVESYGGKYGISLTYHIHNMNKILPPNHQINLVGLSIGDGAISPQVQFDGLHDLLYFVGFANENEREIGRQYEQTYVKLIAQQDWENAFHVFDQYINGDFWPYPTYVQNITGLNDYFNILSPNYPPNPFVQYLNRNDVRNATHVGTYGYADYNKTSEFYLITDWLQSVEYKLPVLLENYKVMIYNGQIDLILGPALTENLLRQVKWSGQTQYLAAKKTVWKNNGVVNGWVRSVNNFRQVIVRNAGHMVPTDQPEFAYDMITRFVKGLSF